MAIDYVDLGYRIRDLRRKKKLTQAELAEMMGITPSYLGHIERASRVASLETLVSACNVLEVSPEYLLGASLNAKQSDAQTAMQEETRLRLNAFLRLAEDAISNWDD